MAHMAASGTEFLPLSFRDVPGWEADDHAAAFRAFLPGARRLLDRALDPGRRGPTTPAALLAACHAALDLGEGGERPDAARAFFEAHFVPHTVRHTHGQGLLTGYYEPVLSGSRTLSATCQIPVYRRPPDLANIVDETERGAKSVGLTHARRTKRGFEPYFTREEIENGALRGQGLELFYAACPVEVFFLHVQGSGVVQLPDGSAFRVTYDGKNGHPYTSIGQTILAQGLMSKEEMSLAALKAWLKADLLRARALMRQNRSYIFFRELPAGTAAPLGAFGIPLSPLRSLAVDTATHAIGTPVFVVAPELPVPQEAASGNGHQNSGTDQGFRRLMIAHDAGSAIVGPERGDIYFGSGEDAGTAAGATRHPGAFYVLKPRRP